MYSALPNFLLSAYCSSPTALHYCARDSTCNTLIRTLRQKLPCSPPPGYSFQFMYTTGISTTVAGPSSNRGTRQTQSPNPFSNPPPRPGLFGGMRSSQPAPSGHRTSQPSSLRPSQQQQQPPQQQIELSEEQREEIREAVCILPILSLLFSPFFFFRLYENIYPWRPERETTYLYTQYTSPSRHIVRQIRRRDSSA